MNQLLNKTYKKTKIKSTFNSRKINIKKVVGFSNQLLIFIFIINPTITFKNPLSHFHTHTKKKPKLWPKKVKPMTQMVVMRTSSSSCGGGGGGNGEKGVSKDNQNQILIYILAFIKKYLGACRFDGFEEPKSRWRWWV